MGNGPAISPL